MVAQVLGVGSHAVTVEVRRMGGGFGGKETQSNLFAVVAALAARKLKRPVKLRPDRDDDMVITGKRHDFVCDYEIGFDDDGHILAVDAVYAARCGWNADLSGPVTDRALFHADNCYFYPAVRAPLRAAAHQHGLQHRLSRLRRAAGHGRGRALHRGGRLRHRARPAGGAPAQSLWRRRAATSRPITSASRT